MEEIRLGIQKDKTVGLQEFICPHCKLKFDFKRVCDVMGLDVEKFYDEGGIGHDALCPACNNEVTLLCDVIILCEKEM